MLRIFATVPFVLVALPALGADISLEFSFVTHTSDRMSQQIGAGDAEKITAAKAFGVAEFADGRRAIKKFVYVSGGGAPIAGISNYTFENGDGITATFSVDETYTGTYTVVGGTGEYEGAAGSGQFKPAAVEGWGAGGDTLAWTGSFHLTTK
ncbi:hypothetical protein [Mangrovicoccus sp. HB161399]|uniref:hypothetical protein n=1 Tax=Mangrovicoccus sp. HB161399 TaxID=2720392 RepID=UPI0015579BAC|nr:hypothetical protein [Mangrovicoccus sp. HB161399]